MFCPKCGSSANEETKFCRSCGVDLRHVAGLVEGEVHGMPATQERYLELFSRGLRGLLIGGGFVIVALVGYLLSEKALPLILFALAFAFVFLGTGISRLVHAAGLRRLKEGRSLTSLSPGDTDYIRPAGLNFDTGELSGRQIGSVTDRTTRHLERD